MRPSLHLQTIDDPGPEVGEWDEQGCRGLRTVNHKRVCRGLAYTDSPCRK